MIPFVIITDNDGNVKVGFYNKEIKWYEFEDKNYYQEDLMNGEAGTKIELLTYQQMADRVDNTPKKVYREVNEKTN